MQQEHPRDGRKRVVYNPEDRDWTALYDEHLVGVFKQPSLARKALDDYAYELARRGQLAPGPPAPHPQPEPLDDPLTLYSPGGPAAATPVSAEQLDAALTHFCATYEQPKVQERARRARALLDEPGRWSIQPDGSVQLAGKSASYLVTDEACRTTEGKDCPDQRYRTGVTGGQCYHTIARELLRLAQAIARQGAGDAPAPEPAFVSLPGRLLGLAISIVYLAEGPARCALADGRLTLSSRADGPQHSVTLCCSDGSGTAAIDLPAPQIAALWGAFRPLAPKLERVQLFIDPAERQLIIAADDFSAAAFGQTPQD